MPPTAYGGALRKAQEAPEGRGRFKSDHLQKRGRLIRYSIAYQMQLRIYKEPTTEVRAEEERANPSSAQDLRASPIKEKWLCRFSTLDFKNDSEQCGTCNERVSAKFPAQDLRVSIKEKRLSRFSPSDFFKAARMPPTAYGGALRKAQEAPERRGRFKSDHLQGYNSLFYKELYCFRKECGVISFFDGMKRMSAHQTRRIPNGGCL